MIEVVSKSVNELAKIHDNIAKLEGVKRICPSIILDVLK